ncbi:4-oxalomesaconate tautomerase [Larsenimonas rhizosphaerae]|uniref:4-oxalomesaconate tautomerase n=1 Tax=Larsenimonas rhizosphaerae TaxID=2944682 RepID=A0AA41ZIH6_9GAMM|nr:4-oxalomesaconate tautomerase [Larsenimonas rhizosphaerae]MCM2131269.1 4-oxalomesaconate tautomerase [Larsenimonas rhizosphaerae]MCX2525372.1 4-oxalomesaconate tautomerase [Larsenimonas rhizosphaerae]
MKSIPCVLMRGGTSKGPLFLGSDLPEDEHLRDEMLLALMGSGNELEVDGIGGGYPQTSKVAIVSPSSEPGIDVDYLFVQVMVEQRRVDTSPNCGNMLSAVGPFAIEQGLVTASGDTTRVTIRNVNTQSIIDADIQTPNGQVTYAGDTRIDGVPGSAAPVLLSFRNVVGAKTGALYPTGQARDIIDGIEVTCVDAAMPMVLIRAADLGKRGDETPEELDADRELLKTLESLRLKAGHAMGLGDVSNKVIPKPVLISAPREGTLQVRYFMPSRCHRALAITGAVGLAIACADATGITKGLSAAPKDNGLMDFEHPSGALSVISHWTEGEQWPSCSLVRTARRLFSGTVFVPDETETTVAG